MEAERPMRRLLQFGQGSMAAWTRVAAGKVVRGGQCADTRSGCSWTHFLTDCMWGMKEKGQG